MTATRQLAVALIAIVMLGIALLSVGAWMISVIAGLFATGTLVLIAGHWLVYLWMRGGNQ
jgi:hypothetical protein